MRKILLIMATIFSLTAVGQVNMTVYLSNGEVKVYDKADVDSVTFGMSGTPTSTTATNMLISDCLRG